MTKRQPRHYRSLSILSHLGLFCLFHASVLQGGGVARRGGRSAAKETRDPRETTYWLLLVSSLTTDSMLA